MRRVAKARMSIKAVNTAIKLSRPALSPIRMLAQPMVTADRMDEIAMTLKFESHISDYERKKPTYLSK